MISNMCIRPITHKANNDRECDEEMEHFHSQSMRTTSEELSHFELKWEEYIKQDMTSQSKQDMTSTIHGWYSNDPPK